VEFYSKNKFEKLVHLVGFIIGILDDSNFNTYFWVLCRMDVGNTADVLQILAKSPRDKDGNIDSKLF